MRIVILVLAVVIAPTSSAVALPFTPNEISAEVLAVRFVETGTDTVCLRCDDADPLNDFRAVLSFFDMPSGDTFFSHINGLLDFTGTTATNLTDVDLHIEIDLRVELQETMFPDEMAEYPVPSVAYGTLTGELFGVSFGGLTNLIVEDCCGGIIGGAAFLSAGYPPPALPVFIEGEGYTRTLITEVSAFGEMPYTPAAAVPEPGTLILLGSGAAGLIARRRRATQPRKPSRASAA